jgi:hypothetical protein
LARGLPAEQDARVALEISHRSYVFEIGKTASARERREFPGTSSQSAVWDTARADACIWPVFDRGEAATYNLTV